MALRRPRQPSSGAGAGVVAGLVLGLSGAFAMTRAFAAYSDTFARSLRPTSRQSIAGFGRGLRAPPGNVACCLPARSRRTEIDPMAALEE